MANASPSLTLRLCGPRGFCAGVDRAIQMVVMALRRYGAPVYVRHEIVHNRYVVDGLREKGAIFVKELDEIPDGSKAPVIFSAHGVPKSVPAHAEALNLLYFDATCPLVSKVHKQAARHMKLGRQVVLVGHAGHPEVVGTMGQLPEGAVDLIETPDDVAAYSPPDPAMLGYVTQTTLSVDDTADVINALKAKFPEIADPAGESICYATTNRQEAVKAAAPGTDLFLVVGAQNSSNSKRLVEVAERAGAAKGLLIAGPDDIDMNTISDGAVVALSAGASAPEILVEGVINRFKDRFQVSLDLVETAQENELFPVARALRDVDLTRDDMRFVNG
ncbi:MAG: 4-hydroxy-3-methylbut-2-enyl diphosphate reductase [Rhizobiales bacterium]|nr:4-hydroxy-3-methylbut-2-enyl diphosphate reductase [Hyphomicrobiales bacterium]MBO6698262.1 4-hydroxy-3-methylbut-2-enyl diphosphate reductase [Hyphomicrobiales bacterium]MBO6735484.1 4-hydroxy-3-methylbut-2-enyl diphosphate reductase [Hyphomicrobiales bacterium]MBO6910708.1 4-hydroxy-3-methylbut-2-enyl diphosphate reductase [Hyphomicrobiales bacterium]MBO6956931.1 4-hydroxy-3-methylbut-2-enyl diphosphate reductase [Hyphomicrobiales bacterium]